MSSSLVENQEHTAREWIYTLKMASLCEPLHSMKKGFTGLDGITVTMEGHIAVAVRDEDGNRKVIVI